MLIDAQTKLYGLFGYPLGHTLSPGMHNAAFEHLGHNAVYLALPVPPDQLAGAVTGMRALGIRGANVTIPHKVLIMPYLDALTPGASVIGAVNTLFWEEDTLWGDNTDAPGFAATLEDRDLAGRSALLLGAGGAAKAVVFALLQKGIGRITVAARRPVDPFGQHRALFPKTPIEIVPFAEVELGVDLVVNATPVGTQSDESPLTAEQIARIPDQALVYDLIYNPPETRFLSLAKERGLVVRNGAGMLARQAAIASERWTGHYLPEFFERKLAELL